MLSTFKKEVDALDTEKLPTFDPLTAIIYLWSTIRAILVLIKIFTTREERLKKIEDIIAWGDALKATDTPS